MLNVCAFVGRLVADPELRQGQNGTVICRFRIAVDRDFVRQGEQRQADFIPCVAFGRTGEFVSKWFHKGSWIAVDGRLRQDSYTDKTGANRTSYEVNVNNVSFVGNKSDNQSGGSNYGGYAPAPAASSNMGSQRPVSDPVPSYSSGSSDDFAVIDDNEDLPF